MNLLPITKALADETRLRLLLLLSQAHLTLVQCETLLDQSGPRLSRHLKILVAADLVVRSKEGKEAYFRLASKAEIRPIIHPIIEALSQNDAYDDMAKLAALIERNRTTAQDLEAKFYAKWNQAREFFVDEQRAETRLAEIAQSLDRPKLLDIGTGTGRLLSALGPYVATGLGIDTDRDMLSIARHRLAAGTHSHMAIRQGDMYNLGPSIGDQRFDLVCLYGVLRYATLPAPVLMQAAGALAAGGTLMLIDFLEHDMTELADTYGHKWLGFNPEDLETWSKIAGLSCQDREEFEGERLKLNLWQFKSRQA